MSEDVSTMPHTWLTWCLFHKLVIGFWTESISSVTFEGILHLPASGLAFEKSHNIMAPGPLYVAFFLSAVLWNLCVCRAEHPVALFRLKHMFFSYKYLRTVCLIISSLLLFLVSLELLPELGLLKSPISFPTLRLVTFLLFGRFP